MVKIIDLEPRNISIIKNKYYIENSYNNEFHLVIYYLNKNKIKLIIRNLDNYNGWIYNLSIKILSLSNENYEIISIGSSIFNYKIINIYTDILIKKLDEYNQKIPKQIIQTSFSDEIKNIFHLNSIYTFQELNPEYKYIFFDDKKCREFIKKKYNESILKYYDILIPGAFKADFFRYCYLYKNGGCYFDCKSVLKVKLRDIIKSDDELLLCQDNHKTGIYNAVIMTSKNNELFMNCIKRIMYKIKNFNNIYDIKNKIEFNKLENILSLTGPDLLYEVYTEVISNNKYIKMNHIIKGSHDNYKNLFIEMNKNIILYKSYNNYNCTGTHYSQLWKTNEILYNILDLNNYKILYKQYIPNIEFNFYLINSNTLLMENLNIINKNKFNVLNKNIKLNIIDKKNNVFNLNIINQNITYQIINLNFNIENMKEIKKIDINIDKKLITIGICCLDNKYYLILKNNTNLEIKKIEFNLYLKNGNKIYQKINILKDILIKQLNYNIF